MTSHGQLFEKISKTKNVQETLIEQRDTHPYIEAWKNPNMPVIQRKLVDFELNELKNNGKTFEVYEALKTALDLLFKDKALKDLKNVSILDVGCSTGYYYDVIKHYYPDKNITYVGCDYNEKSIELAKKYNENVAFEVQDATELKYPEKVFDIVLASGILTYVPDTYRLLDSITKVCKHYVILHRVNIRKQPFILKSYVYDNEVIKKYFTVDRIKRLMGDRRKFQYAYGQMIYPQNPYSAIFIFRRDYFADAVSM